MRPYRYTVTEEVLVAFSQARSREREDLLRAFNKLVEDPFLRGQASFKDEGGRECQVQRAGSWMLVYWVEHADSRIHIVAVERLRTS